MPTVIIDGTNHYVTPEFIRQMVKDRCGDIDSRGVTIRNRVDSLQETLLEGGVDLQDLLSKYERKIEIGDRWLSNYGMSNDGHDSYTQDILKDCTAIIRKIIEIIKTPKQIPVVSFSETEKKPSYDYDTSYSEKLLLDILRMKKDLSSNDHKTSAPVTKIESLNVKQPKKLFYESKNETSYTVPDKDLLNKVMGENIVQMVTSGHFSDEAFVLHILPTKNPNEVETLINTLFLSESQSKVEITTGSKILMVTVLKESASFFNKSLEDIIKKNSFNLRV